jgi:uncharacterized protein (DUF2141 family)
MRPKNLRYPLGIAVLGALALGVAAPGQAQYRQKIGNDLGDCRSDDGPAVLVTLDGVKSSTGRIRVQAYRPADWLKKGRWINRIELPAKAGTMTFCLPVPGPGSYGVAVRHDVDGDNKTDLFGDGGAMSNNPSVNLFNLGRPAFKKAEIAVGNGVKSIRITMRYR